MEAGRRCLNDSISGFSPHSLSFLPKARPCPFSGQFYPLPCNVVHGSTQGKCAGDRGRRRKYFGAGIGHKGNFRQAESIIIFFWQNLCKEETRYSGTVSGTLPQTGSLTFPIWEDCSRLPCTESDTWKRSPAISGAFVCPVSDPSALP